MNCLTDEALRADFSVHIHIVLHQLPKIALPFTLVGFDTMFISVLSRLDTLSFQKCFPSVSA